MAHVSNTQQRSTLSVVPSLHGKGAHLTLTSGETGRDRQSASIDISPLQARKFAEALLEAAKGTAQ